MKIALIHDYLREYGGAERVLEALHQIWPDAPVYTAFFDKKALGLHAQNFKDWKIKETWITKLPFYKKLFSPYRIFAARAFASLDLSEFDVVISSSNAYMAKAVLSKRKSKNQVHLCYCHTPPRALYGYTTKSNWQENIFTRIIGEIINHFMRIIDFDVSQKVDFFIANSEETRARIKKFYKRDSEIIYPPVNIYHQKLIQPQNYYLYVNRLALAKHPELAVQAALKLNLNLHLVGSGPMLGELQNLVSAKGRSSSGRKNNSNIKFLGNISDPELAQEYAGAQALLYPVEDEDFGIVPVEAMSYGLPVIAHRSGGPKETILDQKTGVFFDKLNLESLVQAIKKSQQIKFNRSNIQKHTQQFSQENFKKNILKFVNHTSP